MCTYNNIEKECHNNNLSFFVISKDKNGKPLVNLIDFSTFQIVCQNMLLLEIKKKFKCKSSSLLHLEELENMVLIYESL